MVTGASSGIGRAVALRAARTGAHLVLVARDGAALAEVAEECEGLGAAGACVEPVDIGDDAAVAGAVRRTLEREGRLDAVVNSAGVVAYGALQAVPVDVFDGVLRTNLLGSANVARHVLPVLRAQGRGHLVLVGSVLGHIAAPGMTAYIVSKWGVRALARQLVLENRDLAHVHVSCVSPGGVDTPIYEQAANYLGVRGRPPAPVQLARARGRGRSCGSSTGRATGARSARPTASCAPASRSLPGVYDALVGPLFGVAALDRTTPVPPGPGNVLAPAADGHSLRGEPARPARGDGTERGDPRPWAATPVTSETYDAVVIGAGPNGLVAANRLADAGWSVVLLEAQPRVGGAVASDREVHPAFVHDTFSSFYPLAAASPTIRVVRPRASRARVAARAGGARPPAARRQLGAAPP